MENCHVGKRGGGALDHGGFNGGPNCSARSGPGTIERETGGVVGDEATDEFPGVGVEGAKGICNKGLEDPACRCA